MSKPKKSARLEVRLVFRMEKSVRGDRAVYGEVCVEQPYSRKVGTAAIREVEAG